MDIIHGVSGIGLHGEMGVGYNRVVYAGRWGLAGDKSPNWAYEQIY